MPSTFAADDGASRPAPALPGTWDMALLPAGTAREPLALEGAAPRWHPAPVPGTAMGALFAAGEADFQRLPAIDQHDVWYRCAFDRPGPAGAAYTLVFEGLATLAQVWLNGRSILVSDNMFQAHSVALGDGLQDRGNTLAIRFAAVGPALQARRPRPRWKTRLVEQQQLRWLRASLLGRIPGWTPAVPAAGPWRPVVLHTRAAGAAPAWQDLALHARLDGDTGRLALQGRWISAEAGDGGPPAAWLHVGEVQVPLHIAPAKDAATDGPAAWQVAGEAVLPQVRRWWPHTHGTPHLHDVAVVVDTGTSPVRHALGRTGFRTVALDAQDGGFSLSVNGVPVFCRGACWTGTDILNLVGSPAATRDALQLARDAGMNMLRVGGTMFYEADDFYRACDELGLLLWHDWMFANMDYPADDASFVASVEAEARQFLRRTQLSPSLALLCGNSEVEQQAAMLGLDAVLWRGPLFSETLPAVGRALRPDLPYWPSSPAGGAMPFQVDAGVAHYFGLGAYRQPLSDARRSGLRFTSECLAFANVPEPGNLDRLSPGGAVPPLHPLWKARVPRDSGAAWDFDDVRDHYLATLFSTDPVRLRTEDPDRYLALARVASGEVMAAAFREWRRQGSSCAGALVWFLRDLWPGAGWGVLDSDGEPKAAWHYLRRSMAPVALFLLDEGLNGLALHAVNDTPQAIDAEVSLTLYRHGSTVVAEGTQALRLPAHGSVQLRGDALLGRFTDSSYAYRFGPPGHDLAAAVLRQAGTGVEMGTDVFFPLGHGFPVAAGVGLSAAVSARGDGGFDVQIATRDFAQAVRIEAPGFRADAHYLHMRPGSTATVVMRPTRPGARLQGTLEALNTRERIRLAAPPASAP